MANALIAVEQLPNSVSKPLSISDILLNGPDNASNASPIFFTNTMIEAPTPIVKISPRPTCSLNLSFTVFRKSKIFFFKPSKSSPTLSRFFLTSSLKSLMAFPRISNLPVIPIK